MSLREKRAARKAEKDKNRLYLESHREDADRLKKALYNATSQHFTIQECESIWMNYSDDVWAAGWMGMPADDIDLVHEVMKYCLVDNER